MYLFLMFACQFLVLQTEVPSWPQNQTFASGEGQNSVPPGLTVTIDPDKLFGEGLSRAWRELDECKDGIHITGRPYSKINFTVKPVDSFDGALLEVFLRGSSAGVTTSSNQQVDIQTDSLTHFQAYQSVQLTTFGMSFSEPEVKVKANQSFKKATGKKNGLAAMIATVAYKRFPRDLHRRSQKISKEIVQKQMYESMAQINQVVATSVTDFAKRFPAIANLDWQLASDSNRIFLYSPATVLATTRSAEILDSSPLMATIHESFLNEYAREKLGGSEVDSVQFRNFFSRNFNNSIRKPNVQPKPWTLHFENTPLVFSFEDDSLKVRINARKVNAVGRKIENISAVFAFRIMLENSAWFLIRDNVKIITESQGARQQMARSIIRQRLEAIIPEKISVPELGANEKLRRMDLDLGVKRIFTKDNSLLISIDHK